MGILGSLLLQTYKFMVLCIK